MATAYVKNDALSFYSQPSESSIVTKLERSGQTEPHYLYGYNEGDNIGILTGEEANGFVQIEYKFDIRRSLVSKSKWYLAIPVVGLAATQVSKWYHETELLWVKQEDIDTESPEDQKEKEQEAIKQKILNGNNTPLTTGSGDDRGGSGNTWIVVGIVSVVAALGGVLWWAFRKPATPAPPAPAPTIIQLPKKGK
ncbi:hypothetical protein [Runella zeae]|uniref:hypothetical protein n=1 Tax=Runella zeae TaxID=94255 RepID=UPI00041B451A|nr:hypothetical protein [Runella zeae]